MKLLSRSYWLLPLLAVACNSDPGDLPILDAATVVDSGVKPQPDASTPDAAADLGIADSGTPDSGSADVGLEVDSGIVPDSGMADSGQVRDSGVVPDSGPADTGQRPDLGVPDMGNRPDLGTPRPDAGRPDFGIPRPDAGRPDFGIPRPDGGRRDFGIPWPDGGIPGWDGAIPDIGNPWDGAIPDIGIPWPDGGIPFPDGGFPFDGSIPDLGLSPVRMTPVAGTLSIVLDLSLPMRPDPWRINWELSFSNPTRAPETISLPGVILTVPAARAVFRSQVAPSSVTVPPGRPVTQQVSNVRGQTQPGHMNYQSLCQQSANFRIVADNGQIASGSATIQCLF